MSKTRLSSGPDLSHIIESLRSLAVPIEDLKFDPRNARLHNARNLEAIKASLAQFSQRKNLVAKRDGTVIAGNGTLEIARMLGWTHIAVAYVDDSDEMAAAYAIADNKTAELAQWDTELLGDILRELKEYDESILDSVGFTEQDIERLISGGFDTLPSDAEWAASGMPEFEQEDQDAKYAVKVNFLSEEDLQAFAELVGQKLTPKTKSIWYPAAAWDIVQDKRWVTEDDEEAE